MSTLTIYVGTRSVTSLPVLAAGPWRSASRAGPTTDRSGPDRALASPLAPPEKTQGSTTPATSGPTGSALSASARLQSSLESRLQQRLASRGSTLCKLTWKKRVADANGPFRGALGVSGKDGRHGEDAGWAETYGVAGTRSEVRGLADAADRRRQHESSGQPTRVQSPRVGETWVGEQSGDCSTGAGGLDRVDALAPRSQRHAGGGDDREEPRQLDTAAHRPNAPAGGASCGVGDPHRQPRETDDISFPVATRPLKPDESSGLDALAPNGNDRTSPLDGFWRDADWLHCTDGKWRPVEPGTFPLADGVPDRVGLLRGYGNAIVSQVAAEVIRAYTEVTDERT